MNPMARKGLTVDNQVGRELYRSESTTNHIATLSECIA